MRPDLLSPPALEQPAERPADTIARIHVKLAEAKVYLQQRTSSDWQRASLLLEIDDLGGPRLLEYANMRQLAHDQGAATTASEASRLLGMATLFREVAEPDPEEAASAGAEKWSCLTPLRRRKLLTAETYPQWRAIVLTNRKEDIQAEVRSACGEQQKTVDLLARRLVRLLERISGLAEDEYLMALEQIQQAGWEVRRHDRDRGSGGQ